MLDLSYFHFSRELITCAIVALIPILGWIYFFQSQHRQRRVYIILTFLAGMLSVVPIKLYERYWDITIFYLEHINLFERLAELTRIPGFATFLAYVLTSMVVFFGLFVFVAIMMFFLEICSGDDTVQTFEDKTSKALESPLLFVMVGAVFGVAAYYLNTRIDHAIWFFVVVGALEEYIKHLVTRFSDEEHITSVADAIQFSIIVALGFAFVENIIYFLGVLGNTGIVMRQIIIYVVLRSIISVSAHVCFSAIMGYYYGIAHFASEMYQRQIREHQHPLARTLHSIMHVKETTLFKEEKMLEGMFLAIVIHAAFNSLLEYNQMAMIVIMLCGLFFLVINLIHRMKIYQRNGIIVD